MNENISHFQSMLDQNPIQFPLLFISVPQDPYEDDNFGLNNNQRKQNLDHDDFFSASPNPFRSQSRMGQKCQSRNEFHNNWKNEFPEAKIQNIEEDECSQTFFLEQKSSDALYDQSSTESKDKQSNTRQYESKKRYRKYKRQRHVKIEAKSDFQLQQFEEFQTSDFKREGTLKCISEIVYQILQKHDNLSFAQVTRRLIKYESNKESKKGRMISERKINNFKRRVYDGLNVFIAAGVAKKIGKGIRLVETCQKGEKMKKRLKPISIKMKKQQHRNKVNELKQQISECQNIVQAKRRALKQLQQQKAHLTSFFTSKSQTHPLHNPSTTIKFPFVCITTNSLSNCEIYRTQKVDQRGWDNSSTCDTEREGDCVEIVFGSGKILEMIKVEGDVDFVERMGRLKEGRGQ